MDSRQMLPTTRSLSIPGPGLQHRQPTFPDAGELFSRAGLHGAHQHDYERQGWHSRLLHLRAPQGWGDLSDAGARSLFSGESREVGLSVSPKLLHGFTDKGLPKRTDAGACRLRPPSNAGAQGDRQELSPQLLHVWTQRHWQLLRGPQPDSGALQLPCGGDQRLQESPPALQHHCAEHASGGHDHHSGPRGLQSGEAQSAPWLDLWDPPLGLRGSSHCGRGRLGHGWAGRTRSHSLPSLGLWSMLWGVGGRFPCGAGKGESCWAEALGGLGGSSD
ncbi:outer dense fiber protein 3B isoform X1 [Ahaetulla prasina]|uniref:outer dense fiber protein 3B isoform X1 n=1 Tax=Ahaetulla prasina TaxID=499056 RepID=UPI002647F81C|nr:outer dense fiber protein 3B isoform X1 [Ahaetulla prasina]